MELLVGKPKIRIVDDETESMHEMSSTMTLDLSLRVESDDEELMADLQALIESVTMAPPVLPVLNHVVTGTTTTTLPVVAASSHSGQ